MLIPPERMGAWIKHFLGQGSEGRATHRRAKQAARTVLSHVLVVVAGSLEQTRRPGIEGLQFCANAKARLDFLELHLHRQEEVKQVYIVFPSPGTFQADLAGRRLIEMYSCPRYSF
jgi:hypothetical protein